MIFNCSMIEPGHPCVTISRSGHLVALMRLRKSVICASGTFTLNGRISPAFVGASVIASNLLEEVSRPNEAAATVAAAAPQKCRRLKSGFSGMGGLQEQ